MEEWPTSSDRPRSVIEVLFRLQSLGFCSKLKAFDEETKGISLFDQILRVFMEDVDRRKKIPGFPAVLGSGGSSVDLFKLYCAVDAKGGYLRVNARGSWPTVAEEIGLDSELAPSLKLVYFKYLGWLNPSLRNVLDRKMVLEGLSSSVSESEVEVEGSRYEVTNHEKNKDQLLPRVVGNGVAFSPSPLERKRNTLLLMLDWVLRVAKNPGDTSAGSISQNGEMMSQVLTARRVIFLRMSSLGNLNGSPLLKKQKAHPFMYEDWNGSHEEHRNGRDNNRNTDNRATKRLRSSSAQLSDTVASLLARYPAKVRVPIGPSFQANIPEWSEAGPMASHDSDETKWLGTRIWPQERKRKEETYPIGKGRKENCRCKVRGSVECIRFHVEEERLRLKLELGSAFRKLGFKEMGEEAAISWTEEEQQRFKALVLLNPPSLDKDLLGELKLAFPTKGMQSLASYYYNVFLLRRRGYQNRETPDSVDTDDEERDFGFLNRPLIRDVVEVRELSST